MMLKSLKLNFLKPAPKASSYKYGPIHTWPKQQSLKFKVAYSRGFVQDKLVLTAPEQRKMTLAVSVQFMACFVRACLQTKQHHPL